MSNTNDSGSGMMMVMVIGIAASACCSMVSSGGLGYLYSTGGMCDSLEVGCEYTKAGNTTTNDPLATADCFGWTKAQCAGNTGATLKTCEATMKAACTAHNPSATWIIVSDDTDKSGGSGNSGKSGGSGNGGNGGKSGGSGNSGKSGKSGGSGGGTSDYTFVKKTATNWDNSGTWMAAKNLETCMAACRASQTCNAFAISGSNNSFNCWLKDKLTGKMTTGTKGTDTYIRKSYAAETNIGDTYINKGNTRCAVFNPISTSGKFKSCSCTTTSGTSAKVIYSYPSKIGTTGKGITLKQCKANAAKKL